jgi:hypothetical protein
VSAGTKELNSSTGHVWAAGFHHVTARSRLATVFKLIYLFFQFSFSGGGKPRITETTDTESENTRARLHFQCFLNRVTTPFFVFRVGSYVQNVTTSSGYFVLP